MAGSNLTDSMDPFPSYFIYRDAKQGEPIDATTPLLFFPSKESDELFDALRAAFPHLKTHSERMRDAMIQFLLDERQAELAGTSPTFTTETTPTVWQSTSSGSESAFSSPELLNFPTPISCTGSPQPHSQPSRQDSASASGSLTPPPLEQMTRVFSLSNTTQPKQRFRRRMTEAEKSDYRKRRIVKACDKCSKRKRKCHHNQAQTEVTSASKASHKVMKPTSNAPNKTLTARTESSPTYLVAQQQGCINGLEFDLVGQKMSDLPLEANLSVDPEVDLDEFLRFDTSSSTNTSFASGMDYNSRPCSPSSRHEWFSEQQGDFVLLDPIRSDHNDERQSHSVQQWPEQGRHYMNDTLGEMLAPDTPGFTWDMRTQARAQAWPDEAQDPQGSQYNQEWQSDVPHNEQYFEGNDLIGGHYQDHVKAEKPMPTHTAHVHDAEAKKLHCLTNGVPIVHKPHGSQLSSDVLRLTGTAKALRMFTGLGRDRSFLPHQSISLERVIDLLRQTAMYQQDRDLSHGLQMDAIWAGLPLDPPSSSRASPSRAIPWVATNGRAVYRDSSAAQKLGLTYTSVSTSSALSQENAIAPQGRPQQHKVAGAQKSSAHTLGEGIANNADMSSKLYMLRKRIARSVPSVVDRNNTEPLVGLPRQMTLNVTNIHAHENVLMKTIPDTQANGGAYLRLGDTTKDIRVDGMVRAEGTRPTKSSVFGPSGEITLRRTMNTGAAVSPATTATSSETPTQATQSQTKSALQSGLAVSEDRLSDHVRYRDHHGRQQPKVADPVGWSLLHAGRTAHIAARICMALAGGLMLTSLLGGAVTPTLLLLASLCTQAGTQDAIVKHQRVLLPSACAGPLQRLTLADVARLTCLV